MLCIDYYIDKNKYWQGTKFGELADYHAIPNLNLANTFNIVSLVTLVAFGVDIGLRSVTASIINLSFS